MIKNKIGLLVVIVSLLAIGCNSWSYKNQNQWDKRYKNCASECQSPINIQTKMVKEDSLLTPLFVSYSPVDTFVVKRTPNLLYINNLNGSVTAPDTNYWGHEFYLARIVFHSPSEHTINGKRFPAEIQLINIDTANKLLIIAVLVTQGQSNHTLSQVLQNIPREQSQLIVTQKFDVNGLLPHSVEYWHYLGSLTYPPCTDSVQWFVMKKQIQASKAQLDSLRAILGNNARQVQPLNNRKITDF